ncbi:MAG: betC, partial [Paenibacillus sp.]|nr:betC [Paenibacillus sp.]
MSANLSANKPHVVIIMADQLRYDVLGGPYTPHLNRLARESTVFDNAYCASPLCVPARGAFFTGAYPNATGCLINPWAATDAPHGKVRAGTPSLYSLLEQDWDSWNVGKQHYLTEDDIKHSTNGATRWIAGMKEYKQYLREHNKPAPGGSPSFKSLVPEMVGGRITRAKAYSTPAVGCYEPGFDYFFDGFFARNGIEAIRQRDPEKPMLLNMMFLAPHPPF